MPGLITAAVNIYDVQANMEGCARLVTFAIGIAAVILLCDKLFTGKKWW